MSQPGIRKHRDQRKTHEEKSHAFAVRLHPSVPEEAMTIAFIQHNLKQGLTMRELIVFLVMEREGRGQEEFTVNKFDANVIRTYLENIFERLKNGLMVQNTQSSDMPMREGMADEELDEYDRFLDMGMSAADLEDED